jgi:DNA (cytosine-5)-methyltransferase 1
MRAIDFFCGAGGLTRGLLDSGIDVVAGFDANPHCRQTYEKNNLSAPFFEQDICDVSPAKIWKILGSRRTSDLLVVGCAPCQPFSKQRKRAASGLHCAFGEVDPDATLLGAFARLVEAILPGQVLIENVPGIAKVKGLSTYRRFLRMLRLNSYDIAEGVLDAKSFGVAQTRRRCVVIATRGRKASLPNRLFGPGLQAYATVRRAMMHFPPIVAGESHPRVPNHVAAVISEKNLERLRSTPHDGGDRRSWPRELELECHKGGYQGHSDVYGRMAWDSPAPTLTGRCNSLSNGRYGHPCQDRAISLREAASLQSFPDAYIFYGLNQQIARQIGNAVPVRFAEVLGRHIQCLREPRRSDLG